MIKVTSFYKFFPIEQQSLKKLQADLLQKTQNGNIRGLILIGEEGINATLAGEKKDLENCKKELAHLLGHEFFWKDSSCEKWNFKRISVKIKKEIINLGQGEAPLNPTSLSPQEWEKKLKSPTQILDIRNHYEWKLGKFKKAQTLNMNNFHDFTEQLKSLKMDKNKETLIYCTGGIRCEKALRLMKDKGFKQVGLLQGGILNYLKAFPNSQFENECFVFDHRVAVDQNLQPSKRYSLCPHCGQPSNLQIICKQCQKPACICQPCKNQFWYYETCSKNCAYHLKANHTCKKKHKTTQKNL